MSLNKKSRPLIPRQSPLQPYLVAASIGLLLCYGSFLFVLDEAQAFKLTREDGPYEVVSAVFFLLTALFLLATFMRNNKRTRRMTFGNAVYLCLGLLFLFGFFEEISWGQRLFGIVTPEYLQEANRQGEINIHNLSVFHARDAEGNRKSGLALLLSAERLFSLFWLTFCCLVPFTFKVHKPTRRLLKRLQFPIVPLSLGGLFAVNYVLSKVITPHLILRLQDPLVEVKECGFACLFLVMGLWFLMHDTVAATPHTVRIPSAQHDSPLAHRDRTTDYTT